MADKKEDKAPEKTDMVDDKTGEVVGTAVVTKTPAQATLVGTVFELGGAKFKIAEQVSRTVLKQTEDKPIYVKFLKAIEVGAEMKNVKGGAPKMEPARVADVLNLETKMNNTLIVNAVLEGILMENYPDNGYVGKSFAILMRPPVDGKRYKTFEVFRLEDNAS